MQTNVNSYGVLSPVSTQQGFHGQHSSISQPVNYAPQQNFTPFTLPPSNFSEAASHEREQQYVPTSTGDYPDGGQQSTEDLMMMDSDADKPDSTGIRQ